MQEENKEQVFGSIVDRNTLLDETFLLLDITFRRDATFHRKRFPSTSSTGT